MRHIKPRTIVLSFFQSVARVMQSAEPFFEAVGPARDVVGATAYRIGYRIQGTGDVLAAIEIPAEIVEEAVTSKLSI